MTQLELKLSAEIEQLKLELLKERQKYLELERILFGRKSEKRLPKDSSQLDINFDKLEVLEQEREQFNTLVDEIQVESHKRRLNKTTKKKEASPVIPASIERRDFILEPEGIDLEFFEKIGEDIREVLEYSPGYFYVKRYIRPKYKLKDNKSLKTKIHQADAHESFIAKSYAGNSILAELVIGKYIDHLPVYRQVEIFKRNGIKLPYSTLNSWIHQVATELYPLYEVLAKQVLNSNYIQVDETTLPVVKDQKKRAVKAYIWGIHDVINEQLFFHYDQGSRAQRVVVSLLKDYKGFIQTDGYKAYSIYEDKKDVVLLGCWAHVRRKFEQALKEDKENANKALDFISLLYQIEANIREKELPPQEIVKERKRLSYPIIKNFEIWMQDIYPKTTPKSLLGKAISYAFSLLFRLSRYINDGSLLIDNNLIENLIRPIALGRKNYLFCDNDNTAKNTALFYSFFGSCKKIGVNPKDWLLDVLGKIQNTKYNDLVNLLPKQWAKINNSTFASSN